MMLIKAAVCSFSATKHFMFAVHSMTCSNILSLMSELLENVIKKKKVGVCVGGDVSLA